MTYSVATSETAGGRGISNKVEKPRLSIAEAASIINEVPKPIERPSNDLSPEKTTRGDVAFEPKERTAETENEQAENKPAQTGKDERMPKPRPMMGEEAYLGVVGKVVELASANSEADKVALLITFLVWAGAIIGNNTYIRIGETIHTVRLFAVLVGASSRARKGTSKDPIKRIMEAVEQKAGLSAMRVTNGPASSGEGVIYAVRDASEAKNENGEPMDEGVADKRMLIIEGEFGAVLVVFKRQGNTLSAIFRNLWDGGDLDPLTKTSKIKATGAHVCIVAHITLDELNLLIQLVDLFNGFANRFLWIFVRRDKLVAFPLPMPDDGVSELAAELAPVFARAHAEKREYSLSDGAIALWSEIYPSLSSDEHQGIVGAITARSEAQAMRLALLYCVLTESDKIQQEHIRAALAVVRYFQQSVLHIFQSSSNPDAERLLSELKSRGELSKTEIHQFFEKHKPVQEINDLLSRLMNEGLVQERKQAPPGGRGKPTCFYRAVGT